MSASTFRPPEHVLREINAGLHDGADIADMSADFRLADDGTVSCRLAITPTLGERFDVELEIPVLALSDSARLAQA